MAKKRGASRASAGRRAGAKQVEKKQSATRPRAGKKPVEKKPVAKQGEKQGRARRRRSSPARPVRRRRRRPGKLYGLSDIRRYFYRNAEPIYFISATNFNLMNTDEWVRNFRFINYIDCFDGLHPNVFVPRQRTTRTFESIEEIVNWLLEHKEVRDYISGRGPGGKATFLFFDEQTEALCEELGLQCCFPPARLRRLVDDKISATRIGNRAGVESVPNVLAKVDSYQTLRKVSRKLGTDLVIQTAFGDSGHTTFFVSSEEDYRKHAAEIEAEPEVKIMKKIRCRQAALEACVTRHGTIVGPLMTELVGFPQLTPYKGGWCGNEIFAGTFTERIRRAATRNAFRFGQELRRLGYRGYFEIDFLVDLDTDKVYLGEVNPRITGASSMTNLAAFAHADAPLFLFHLLEWSDVDFEVDIDELNERWSDPSNIDSWSQLVIKHTREPLEVVTRSPRTGVWQLLADGSCAFVRTQTHRRTVESESQGFFLRIMREGDYRYKGADVGILLTPGRLMDDDFRLNDRARAWIRGMLGQYAAEPVSEGADEPHIAIRPAEVGSFKML